VDGSGVHINHVARTRTEHIVRSVMLQSVKAAVAFGSIGEVVKEKGEVLRMVRN
jgi:hypothetical protein